MIRVRSKKRMVVALLLCLALVGTVSAAVFSNSTSGNITLLSEHPILIEWSGVPLWQDIAFCYMKYSATLLATNQDPANGYTINLVIVVTPPAGADETSWLMERGAPITFTDNLDGTFTGRTVPAPIAAGQSGQAYILEWTFLAPAASYLGSYSLLMYMEST